MISLDDYKLDGNAVVGRIVWKPVFGKEGHYEVSDYGVVRSARVGTTYYHKMLKPSYDVHGYVKYNIICGGRKSKKMFAHRLVAKTFISNPNNYPVVDHINTVRTDNRVENLRWCTSKDNFHNPISLKTHHKAILAYKMSERGQLNIYKNMKKAAIKTGLHVICLENGKWYNSAKDVAKDLGVEVACVSRSCRRYEKHIKIKKYTERKGKPVYHFRFATEEENAVNIPIYRDKLLKELGDL